MLIPHRIGAILCLPIYFWGRLVKLVRFFPHGSRGDRTVATHPLSLTLIAFLTKSAEGGEIATPGLKR